VYSYLLRPALECIIDLGHPLVRLAPEIDWGFLDKRFGPRRQPDEGAQKRGHPALEEAGLIAGGGEHRVGAVAASDDRPAASPSRAPR